MLKNKIVILHYFDQLTKLIIFILHLRVFALDFYRGWLKTFCTFATLGVKFLQFTFSLSSLSSRS